MTAPTLPETLLRLAQLLPERVRVGGGDAGTVTVLVQTRETVAPHLGINSLHSWECIGFAGPDPRYVGGFGLRDLRLLEFALREECEVRGWMWRRWAGLPGHGFGAEVERRVFTQPFQGLSDTPAHALALAMLGALGGEGTHGQD